MSGPMKYIHTHGTRRSCTSTHLLIYVLVRSAALVGALWETSVEGVYIAPMSFIRVNFLHLVYTMTYYKGVVYYIHDVCTYVQSTTYGKYGGQF
ncbi:hypothetical protein B0T13DRAFT_473733 [Neurospora crassa]|nr:hypothetical protein B0T13DRAFT_473733 [Neurospora crassa]